MQATTYASTTSSWNWCGRTFHERHRAIAAENTGGTLAVPALPGLRRPQHRRDLRHLCRFASINRVQARIHRRVRSRYLAVVLAQPRVRFSQSSRLVIRVAIPLRLPGPIFGQPRNRLDLGWQAASAQAIRAAGCRPNFNPADLPLFQICLYPKPSHS